ncbi:uncharacterized protein with transglutaminase domain [Shimia isoporae]|uniref:Uncharacterized protein with transglutaminase domain n=1 Tax=Shimia isoporae TaxID=647720 RepID=A0A4R1NM25_9RHOB|nr:UUP1 family membrane protein [Shimia isoporae]TCL08771.1 uncharacterized protein with transglutaminase domain [Shimia isoporae]
MSAKQQLRLMVAVLLLVGFGVAGYKHFVLGFPITPGEKENVWTLQAQITFEAQDEPVRVALNLPDMTRDVYVVPQGLAPPGYAYHIEQSGGPRVGVWETRKQSGPQRLFFRARVYKGGGILPDLQPPSGDPAAEPFADPEADVADALLEEAYSFSADQVGLGLRLAETLWEDAGSDYVQALLGDEPKVADRAAMTVRLLRSAGVHAHELRGIYLEETSRSLSVSRLIELWDGESWRVIVPVAQTVGMPSDFVPFARQDELLYEVSGGSGSEIVFSGIVDRVSSRELAVQLGRETGAGLVDFSILALPVDVQNTFATLLLIPIGALVVVVLRNLVGLQTSGTFMPILIALTFVQTELIAGLSLFLIVVGVGLVIRGYLTSLNLLLVPRIAAVLIVVTGLYLALSVVGFKLGVTAALSITFFPMIIIAWTIERMSVLAEEEGMRDVLVQGGGSLFTAIVAYLLMTDRQVAYLTFAYPELLLVVLALILVIGQYTGYRLSELRRFEPLTREDT